MRRGLLIFISVITLAGCKEDTAVLPQPVEMTTDALGFYCQMDLLKHDGPKGQIHLDGMPAPIFFAQIRDAIAYLHMPEQSHAVQVAYVQDMASAESWERPGAWIPLTEAFFVVGSSKMGGMGAPEFVPFSDQEAAAIFSINFGGTVRAFVDISTQDVLTVAPTESTINENSDTDIASRLRALSPSSGSN